MVEIDTPEKLEEYVTGAITSLAHEKKLDLMNTLKRFDFSPDCGISYSIFPNKTLSRMVDLDKLSPHDVSNLRNYLGYLESQFVPQLYNSMKQLDIAMVYVGEDIGEFTDITFYDPFRTIEKRIKDKIDNRFQDKPEEAKDLADFLSTTIVPYDPRGVVEKKIRGGGTLGAAQYISKIGIGTVSGTSLEQLTTLIDILGGRSKLDFAELKRMRQYYEEGVPNHKFG